MTVIDPQSEAGQQMIKNSTFEKPVTQGDAPPEPEGPQDEKEQQ